MSRLQLALNVSNLDEAVEFYTKFFKTEPAKIRAGLRQLRHRRATAQARALREPSAWGHHQSPRRRSVLDEEVVDATTYLAGQGFATDIEEQTTCCYALQDKVWVDGPDALALGGLHRARQRRDARDDVGTACCCD